MEEQIVKPEVGEGDAEPKESPAPKVSEPSVVPTPSSVAVDEDALVEKLVERILPKFEEAARRRAQSVFDKTSYQFERMAEYLKAAGGDPKRAAREMALDDIAERELNRQAGQVQGRTEPVDPQKLTRDFLDRLYRRSGIDLTDEDLQAAWGGKQFSSYEEAFEAAEIYAWKKAKGEKVGPAAAVTEGGGQAPPKADLEKQYIAEILAARGRGYAVGREIRAKYRALGLDVDSVVVPLAGAKGAWRPQEK